MQFGVATTDKKVNRKADVYIHLYIKLLKADSASYNGLENRNFR
jgi:hypothetical protein